MFKNTGFGVHWHFYSAENSVTDLPAGNDGLYGKIISDLLTILKICAMHELLVPEYYIDDNYNKIKFESNKIEFVVKDIQRRKSDGIINTEINGIGGYGIVNLPNGERSIQNDLICIEFFRLFERNFRISTYKGIWVPINIDLDYNFEWQVELAKNNGDRLKNCLDDVYKQTNLTVSPGETEVYKDGPVWQKGFKLLVDPSILKREFELGPPPTEFNVEDFILNCEL